MVGRMMGAFTCTLSAELVRPQRFCRESISSGDVESGSEMDRGREVGKTARVSGRIIYLANV